MYVNAEGYEELDNRSIKLWEEAKGNWNAAHLKAVTKAGKVELYSHICMILGKLNLILEIYGEMVGKGYITQRRDDVIMFKEQVARLLL
jgi:hypothetical protein